jgi:hypothetical protein
MMIMMIDDGDVSDVVSMSRHYQQVLTRAEHNSIPLSESINMLLSSRTAAERKQNIFSPRLQTPKRVKDSNTLLHENRQGYT